MRASSKNLDIGLLIIRLILGIAFVFVYGGPRLLAGPHHWHEIGLNLKYFGIYFLPGIWGFIAVGTEFLGGILILLGLYLRPVAVFLAITMFVASVSQIYNAGWSGAINPIVLMFVIIGLFFTGPGKYRLIVKNNRRTYH